MITMMSRSLQAVRAFFGSHPSVVLVLAAVLYLLFSGRKQQESGRRFTITAAAATGLVLCPVTSAFLAKYQTGLYGQAWTFSLIPMAAIPAYVIALLLTKQNKEKKKESPQIKGKALAGLAAIGVLVLLTGICEQRAVDPRDLKGGSAEGSKITAEKEAGRSLGLLLKGQDEGHDRILWAPREVLQWIRCYDGQRKILYGRNMWEPDAAAYAYDSYDEEIQSLYLWMEALTKECEEQQTQGNGSLTGTQDHVAEDSFYLQMAYEKGALVWVTASCCDFRMTPAVESLERQCGVKVEKTETELGYTIWMIGLGDQYE